MPHSKSPGDDEAEHKLLTGEKAQKRQARSSTVKISLLAVSNLATLGLLACLLFKIYVQPPLIPAEKSAFLKQCCVSRQPVSNEAILTCLIAPVLDEIELRAFLSQMNGTFFPLEIPSFGSQEVSLLIAIFANENVYLI